MLFYSLRRKADDQRADIAQEDLMHQGQQLMSHAVARGHAGRIRFILAILHAVRHDVFVNLRARHARTADTKVLGWRDSSGSIPNDRGARRRAEVPQ